jgi:hypothetical protein
MKDLIVFWAIISTFSKNSNNLKLKMWRRRTWCGLDY